MATFSHIVGHRRPISALQRAIRAQKLAHGLLFSGPAGVGKATTALALACTLNCEEHGDDACGQCSACRRMMEGNHPDLVVVAPDGSFIKIDQVRRVEQRLAVPSHEGHRRVVIVDGAEMLHPSAANALLKSVEEPPGDTVFVLVTAAPHRVIPTLVSRCQRIRFAPLTRAEVETVVSKQLDRSTEDPSTEHVSVPDAVDLAEGRPGHALALLHNASLAGAQEIAHRIWSAAADTSAITVFEAAAESGRDRAQISQALELLQLRLRNLLLAALGLDHGRLLALDDATQLEKEARALGTSGVLRQLSALQEAQRALAGNANAAITVETLTLGLREEITT